MKIQLENTYEIKCTLGTIKDIENKFKKSFNEIIGSLGTLSTSEQIQMLYLGAKRANNDISENDFVKECEDSLGLGDLSEYIEEFILQLQFPGQSKEEIQKKISARLETLQKAKGLTGAQS